MKMKLQTPAVFALGAAGYAALELLWRGRTHWTMALTGGAVLVGLRRLRRLKSSVSQITTQSFSPKTRAKLRLR